MNTLKTLLSKFEFSKGSQIAKLLKENEQNDVILAKACLRTKPYKNNLLLRNTVNAILNKQTVSINNEPVRPKQEYEPPYHY